MDKRTKIPAKKTKKYDRFFIKGFILKLKVDKLLLSP